jgi:hypothetical protein
MKVYIAMRRMVELNSDDDRSTFNKDLDLENDELEE